MKKRSGASYRSKRDNPLELFVDRCLGKNVLPEALRKLPNLIVHVHDDNTVARQKADVSLPGPEPRSDIIFGRRPGLVWLPFD